MGDEVHAGLQKAVADGLPEGYRLVGHELRVRSESFHVSGRLDTLLYRPDGALEVVEDKSTRTKAFGYGDLPKPEHVLQLGIYGTFPATRKNPEVDGQIPLIAEDTFAVPDFGRLVYWSKDDAAVMEFPITITDELRENVKKKLVHLDEQYAVFKDCGDLPDPLPAVPLLVAGQPALYLIGPKKGEPKTKPDWRISYGPFLGSGKCCGDPIES